MDKSDEIAKIKILFDYPYIGIMTPYDTLVLKKKSVGPFTLYEDEYNDDQLYDVDFLTNKNGFIVFVMPCKPYKRRLHSLIISGL